MKLFSACLCSWKADCSRDFLFDLRRYDSEEQPERVKEEVTLRQCSQAGLKLVDQKAMDVSMVKD